MERLREGRRVVEEERAGAEVGKRGGERERGPDRGGPGCRTRSWASVLPASEPWLLVHRPMVQNWNTLEGPIPQGLWERQPHSPPPQRPPCQRGHKILPARCLYPALLSPRASSNSGQATDCLSLPWAGLFLFGNQFLFPRLGGELDEFLCPSSPDIPQFRSSLCLRGLC